MSCFPNFSGQNSCMGVNTYQIASGGLKTECVSAPFGYGRCCKSQNESGYLVGNVYFVPQTAGSTVGQSNNGCLSSNLICSGTFNAQCGGCGCGCATPSLVGCGGFTPVVPYQNVGRCANSQCGSLNCCQGGAQGQNGTCQNALNFLCLCRLFS